MFEKIEDLEKKNPLWGHPYSTKVVKNIETYLIEKKDGEYSAELQ